MAQLVESVKRHGVLEPLIVRPLDSGDYEIVAGERRYRAAKAAGLTEIPVVIHDFDEQGLIEVALLENLQREDLNPIDETEGMLKLLCHALDLTTEAVIQLLNRAANAKRRDQKLTDNVKRQIEIIDELFMTVGRTNRESFRTNRLPLLNLPEDVLEVLRQGKLEYTKAKAIAKLDNPQDRQQVIELALAESLSLSRIKQEIRNLQSANTPDPSPATPTLQTRFKSTLTQSSPAWSDKKKQKKLERLLAELEKVLGE
jgi:ParB family chromosome partitioning protein